VFFKNSINNESVDDDNEKEDLESEEQSSSSSSEKFKRDPTLEIQKNIEVY
jgi:hypothetical protein